MPDKAKPMDDMKKTVTVLFTLFAMGWVASAQTNFQTFYDFGRKHFTTTLEGFHQDNWGNTFFFVDYDYNNRDGNSIVSPNNTYFEIARCFNFWSDSALAPLSFQLEYNGGFGTWGRLSGAPGLDYGAFAVNSAFLAGVDWFLHSDDFNNTLNFKLLYKHFVKLASQVPLQFTAVWGCQDLFGLKGLRSLISGAKAASWCSSPNPRSGSSCSTTSTSAAKSSSATTSPDSKPAPAGHSMSCRASVPSGCSSFFFNYRPSRASSRCPRSTHLSSRTIVAPFSSV